jgi:hypothetical protein
MCAGCRERAPKKELIRIVRTPTGDIVVDARDKAPGRGAYLCRKSACLKKAQKSRALERMLNAAIPPDTYDRLGEVLDGLDS